MAKPGEPDITTRGKDPVRWRMSHNPTNNSTWTGLNHSSPARSGWSQPSASSWDRPSYTAATPPEPEPEPGFFDQRERTGIAGLILGNDSPAALTAQSVGVASLLAASIWYVTRK